MKKLFGAALLAVMFSTQAVWAEATSISVETLEKDKSALGGKQVEISGEVVKVNNGIMKRNFIHVQDSTGKVIVTSQDTANVGDKVTAVGTVGLNVEFGMGYTYELLVEKASINKH